MADAAKEDLAEAMPALAEAVKVSLLEILTVLVEPFQLRWNEFEYFQMAT